MTARVRRGSLQEVWSDHATLSVKASHSYSPDVEPPSVDSEPETTIDARRPAGITETGAGVAVGFVDWGCDFTHPDLRNADGSTRLLGLWDHRSSAGTSAAPYGYGRIFETAEIDAALRAADPFDALDYHPATFDTGLGAHGTHTLSIAAGNGSAGGPEGLAPGADIIFVNLGRREGPDVVPLGRSVELLESVHYMATVAASRCLVVNLSLGRHAGAHTGRSLVERSMDHFVSSAPGRAIVQSGGNYYQRRTHGSWQLTPGSRREFIVEVDSSDATTNEVDIWYSGRDRIAVQLSSPELGLEELVRQGSSTTLRHGALEIARVYHRADRDPNNGDHQCSIMLEPTADAPRWRVTLIAEDVVDGRVHAWIERDSGCRACQSRFNRREADPQTTTGTIANGFRTIVVGAIDAHHADAPIAPFSSSGPTADGRLKPDLVAGGVMELGARSRPASGATDFPYVRMSGTSMAAPAVTGAVALMFERGGHLRIEDTRSMLLASCDPVGEDADPRRVGAGRLNVRAALELVPAAPTSRTPSSATKTIGTYDSSPLWPPPTSAAQRHAEGATAGPLADVEQQDAEPDCGCGAGHDADSPRAVSIAVVGGGLSGLMAASRLAQGGFTVTLFEASDRLGGRVWTRGDLIPGKVIEAGAELIGSNHPLWLRLADTHGLKRVKVSTEDDYQPLRTRWRFGGSDLSRNERKAIEQELKPVKQLLGREAATVDRLRPWVSAHAEAWDRISVAQRLRQGDVPALSDRALGYLEFVLANDQCAPTERQSYLGLLSAISAHRLGGDMLAYWERTEDFRCAGGNQQLASRLGALVPDIRLSSPVSRLSLTATGVEVTWARGGAQVRDGFSFAILANPPSTWPAIDADPPFRREDYTVGSGPAVKYLTTAATEYWERSGLAPLLLTDELGSVWESTDGQGARGLARPDRVGLSVYSGGPFVLPAAEYRRGLQRCFPGYARHVTGEVLVDWPNDPFTRTGYAVPRPGDMTTIMKRLSRPFGGRLFFAGEQASPGYFGYMEGALDAGLRASYLVAAAAAALHRPLRSEPTSERAGMREVDARGIFDRLGMPELASLPERDGDLEVVAAPAENLGPGLDAGDLLVTRGRGSPHANVSVILSPETRRRDELPSAGLVTDSRLPGLYVHVIDPVLHHGETRFARRVADELGAVPRNTLIVRDHGHARWDGAQDATESAGCVPAPEPASGGSPHPVLRRNVRRPSVGYAQQCLNVFLARHARGTLSCRATSEEVRGTVSRAAASLAAAGQSPLVVDCSFGRHTELAVKAFQACAGLDRDGIIGAKTWPALKALPATAPSAPGSTASRDCSRAVNSITSVRAWEREFLATVDDRGADEFAGMVLVIGPLFHPGMQLAPILQSVVRVALKGGNAITIGSTVWFPRAIDTSTTNDLAWLVHESVHVLDYAAAGVEAFLLAYAATAVSAGFEHDRIPSERRANRFEGAAEALLAQHPTLRDHIARCEGDAIIADLRANRTKHRATVNAHLAQSTP
ncbi:FAD-dependent oxidoreductase [Agrococcus sp. DT81.2]|uniref:FAD-dependent oxidoreductase n=1 Tax=Agrococcus sp. DT81.2 TaxID=3393414 RepID=UPI003CE58E04